MRALPEPVVARARQLPGNAPFPTFSHWMDFPYFSFKPAPWAKAVERIEYASAGQSEDRQAI